MQSLIPTGLESLFIISRVTLTEFLTPCLVLPVSQAVVRKVVRCSMYAQQSVRSRHLVNLKNSVMAQEGGRVMTEKSPQFEVPCSTWLCSFGPGQRIWIEGGDQQMLPL